jgi:hypothetical protein
VFPSCLTQNPRAPAPETGATHMLSATPFRFCVVVLIL